MTKFKCYSQSGCNDTPKLFATVDSIDEAAKKCDNYCNGERNHECLKAIKEYGFYMVGYGPTQLFYEKVEC